MAGETEPAKLLLPYLQRADELQKHEPLVSYYCRLYAMERGLKIPQGERTKTTNSLLISLMNQLEKDKKSLKLGPDDNLYVEGFGLNVFAKADKQDRAGRADLNTAKTFYAASIFFEILNQFGVPQPDIEQKQKYAVWKAADIRKAVKEGRKPIAGPPAGDDDLSIPSSDTYEKGPGPSEPIDRRYEPGPSQFHDPPNNDQHSVNVPPHVRFHDTANEHNSSNAPPPFQYHDQSNDNHSTSAPPHHSPDDASNYQHSANTPPPPRSYSSSSCSPHDFPPPPSGIRPENSDYSQPFYGQESMPPPPQHLPHNFPPPDTSPNSFAHFQSYPSFSESTIPAVSSNFSYFQGSDAAFAPPPPTSHQPAPQVRPNISRNGSAPEPVQAKTYEYDCNFQPAPEKIADAQKAARFAVGALAFDEVPVAVAHLTKALELLTRPS